MPKSRPITPKELAEIKASADAARSWLYGNYGLAGNFFKSLRRKRQTPQQEAALRLQWAKWRQRLKLKPFKRQKLEATWTGKGWKFEPVDRRAKRGASVYGKSR